MKISKEIKSEWKNQDINDNIINHIEKNKEKSDWMLCINEVLDAYYPDEKDADKKENMKKKLIKTYLQTKKIKDEEIEGLEKLTNSINDFNYNKNKNYKLGVNKSRNVVGIPSFRGPDGKNIERDRNVIPSEIDKMIRSYSKTENWDDKWINEIIENIMDRRIDINKRLNTWEFLVESLDKEISKLTKELDKKDDIILFYRLNRYTNLLSYVYRTMTVEDI